MLGVNAATIELLMKDSRFQSAVKRTKAIMKGLQQRMQVVATAARNMLIIGGGALAGLLKLASDYEESGSKFKAVFRDQATEVESWADTTARAVQRNKNELMAFLATVQDTFVPMGFARGEATKMSKTIVQLAIDLGSFNNVADAEVITLLTSALVGNHEAVRRFGITITEATLKQELLSQGITTAVAKVDNQTKALTRMNLILRQSSDAQGDAERTADSFANTLKGLIADLKGVGAELGGAFMPIMKDFIKAVREQLPPLLEGIRLHKETIVQLVKWGAAMTGIMVLLPKLIVALTAVGVTLKYIGTIFKYLTSMSAGIGTVIAIIWKLTGITKDALINEFKLNAAMNQSAIDSERSAAIWRDLAAAKQAAAKATTKEDKVSAETRRLHALRSQLKLVDKEYRNLIASEKIEAYQLHANAKARENLERQIAEQEARLRREKMRKPRRKSVEESEEDVKLRKEIDKTTAALQEQIDTWGKNADAVKLYRLRAKGAREEELRGIKELNDVLSNMQRFEDALDDKLTDIRAAAEERASEKRALQDQAQYYRDMTKTAQQRLQEHLRSILALEKSGQLSAAESADIRKRLQAKAEDRRQERVHALESLDATYQRIAAAAASRRKTAQAGTTGNIAVSGGGASGGRRGTPITAPTMEQTLRDILTTVKEAIEQLPLVGAWGA